MNRAACKHTQGVVKKWNIAFWIWNLQLPPRKLPQVCRTGPGSCWTELLSDLPSQHHMGYPRALKWDYQHNYPSQRWDYALLWTWDHTHINHINPRHSATGFLVQSIPFDSGAAKIFTWFLTVIPPPLLFRLSHSQHAAISEPPMNLIRNRRPENTLATLSGTWHISYIYIQIGFIYNDVHLSGRLSALPQWVWFFRRLRPHLSSGFNQ